MTAPKSSLTGLLVAALSVIGCPQPNASFAVTQSKSQLKRTKKVQVSIRNVKQTYSDSASTSFTVGPKSKPTATVYWNGYGFICKNDSGEEFWGIPMTSPFRNVKPLVSLSKRKSPSPMRRASSPHPHPPRRQSRSSVVFPLRSKQPKAPTAAQQGAAPDRLQLRSFLTSLPAAGELGRSAVARGFSGAVII